MRLILTESAYVTVFFSPTFRLIIYNPSNFSEAILIAELLKRNKHERNSNESRVDNRTAKIAGLEARRRASKAIRF